MLPIPIEIASDERRYFAVENHLGESALRLLLAEFPFNTDPAHVLLKIIAINSLYKARVLDMHIHRLAEHIVQLGIDPLLDLGSLEVVESIAQSGTKRYYSFATKYCSWHRPHVYPMWDWNVDECLWAYRKQDNFCTFQRQQLSAQYEKHVEVVNAFRSRYGLGSLQFKELDEFLWSFGDKLMKRTILFN